MGQRESQHGEWTSYWGFILATSGAAVGLGNIWKFPYIAGENGGGAFVLIYLVCILVIGVPLMMAEVMLGRRGRQNPAGSMTNVAKDAGVSPLWKVAGGLGIVASFLVLSYYCVIAGWALDYVFKSAFGAFHQADANQVNGIFQALVDSLWWLIFWQTIIIGSTVLVVCMGVEKGLEPAVKFLFPSLFALLLVIVGYSMETGFFTHGLHFLFHPSFSKITPVGILTAVGHAFFTLSLATGSIMMYGAYLPKGISIPKTSLFIAAADTMIALLAGLAIFPIVFAHGLEPGAGPGLIFQTLPLAFGQMPYGDFFATLFFIMLVFAAFTSTISLLEPSVAWAIETLHWSRKQAAAIMGFGIWFVGLGTVFSFNIWENFHIFGMTIFDFLDTLTASYMLPIGGLLIALFAVWRFAREDSMEELEMSDGLIYKMWRVSLGVIAPIGIIFVFLNVIGLLG